MQKNKKYLENTKIAEFRVHTDFGLFQKNNIGKPGIFLWKFLTTRIWKVKNLVHILNPCLILPVMNLPQFDFCKLWQHAQYYFAFFDQPCPFALINHKSVIKMPLNKLNPHFVFQNSLVLKKLGQ